MPLADCARCALLVLVESVQRSDDLPVPVALAAGAEREAVRRVIFREVVEAAREACLRCVSRLPRAGRVRVRLDRRVRVVLPEAERICHAKLGREVVRELQPGVRHSRVEHSTRAKDICRRAEFVLIGVATARAGGEGRARDEAQRLALAILIVAAHPEGEVPHSVADVDRRLRRRVRLAGAVQIERLRRLSLTHGALEMIGHAGRDVHDRAHGVAGVRRRERSVHQVDA